MAPKSREFSSPILPLERLMMRIFSRSIISRMSTADDTWPTIFRISGFEANCPTLFWIAATASRMNCSGYFANSFSQNPLITGSESCATIRFRNSFSPNMRLMPRRVDPGISSRARMAFASRYSIRGEAPSGLNVLDGHIFEERGLAHAGLPDDVDVLPPVLALDAETLPFAAEVRDAEERNIVLRRDLGHRDKNSALHLISQFLKFLISHLADRQRRRPP